MAGSVLLRCGSVNIRQQTGFKIAKQKQIEDFIMKNQLDICSFQEIDCDNETFGNCNFISSSFNLIVNNSANKFGTACLVKSDLQIENLHFDTNGRIIVFDVADITVVSVYLPSGTSPEARTAREEYSGSVLPRLLTNRQRSGYMIGDWNCLLQARDCSGNAAAKLSPCLARLVNVFGMSDSYRSLHPTGKAQSRYYTSEAGQPGFTRIDTSYAWGDLQVATFEYLPLSFSDHFGIVVEYLLPAPASRLFTPKPTVIFKIQPEVIQDEVFKQRLNCEMTKWTQVKDRGVSILRWWELIFKPCLKEMAICRSKELRRERRGVLNLLYLQQSHLARRVHKGEVHLLGELGMVHWEIEQWYDSECAKVILQAKADECDQSEKVRIYHHELHRRRIQRSSIVKLQTNDGLKEGHDDCASHLQQQVRDLLLQSIQRDEEARKALLGEVAPVFTTTDNQMLLAPPTQSEVKKVLSQAHLLASPGCDGVPALLYKECWDVVKGPLTEMIQAIFAGQQPTLQQRTYFMVFLRKPKKMNCFKDTSLRRVSLLCSDMKLVTGIEALRFHSTATHSLSNLQLVAGSDRRIHHGICFARDAIQAASRRGGEGCGMLDLDFFAGFDFLQMCWVYAVLLQKNLDPKIVHRLSNIYSNNFTIPVINQVHGQPIPNLRGSLRQGDIPSMFWFAIGLDPLLFFLERPLAGIPVFRLPLAGPNQEDGTGPQPVPEPGPETNSPSDHLPVQAPPSSPSKLLDLDPAPVQSLQPPPTQDPVLKLEETYKLIAYADDVKASISCMNDFFIVIGGCSLLERASGVRLHRDPASGKVTFLPLCRWRGTLQQEDIPFNFIQLTKELAFVGVTLTSSFISTRKINCDTIESRVKSTIEPWKGGKFMDCVLRAHSVNCHGLSKAWFKCSSIPLRSVSATNLTKYARAWMFQDFFIKPSGLVLHRDIAHGGLGMQEVECRALALLLRTFLERAVNPEFRHSLYASALYRTEVLGEWCGGDVRPSPYYNKVFFDTLRFLHKTSCLDLATASIKQLYSSLQKRVLCTPATDLSPPVLLPVTVETLHTTVNWPNTWRLLRLPGLPSDLSSFGFRLLHDLLPTQERVARFGGNRGNRAPGMCRRCREDISETQTHVFKICPSSLAASTSLLTSLCSIEPDLTFEAILHLQLPVEASLELPLVTAILAGLQYLWTERLENKVAKSVKFKAKLEARAHILTRTKHQVAAQLLTSIISNFST